jgi:hypothetical protein
MRAPLVPSLVVIGLTLGAGCGSGSSGGPSATLDCAWLASDNCWKMTVAEASSCLPPSSETGVLSADNASCSYASGATVAFTPALVLPTSTTGNTTWNFTIMNGGQSCLHFQDTGPGFVLTVGGHTVTESSTGAIGLRITCPDGTSYASANALDLLSCQSDGGATAGGLPGTTWSDTSTSVSLALIGTSATSPFPGETPMFDCSR